jgi:sulfur carrier protein
MRIVLNGRDRFTDAATVAELVATEELDPRIVATAVNGVFVPREVRAATVLAEGDAVELLTPRQGG